MLKSIFLPLLVSVLTANVYADSLYYELPVVEIRSAPKEAILRLNHSEGLLKAGDLQMQVPNGLLPAVNNIPGVRMEERSPGSYRFSIRGSLLRSPFGVRNVKFYISDWSLTDASGNTYLNSLDVQAFNNIRVVKGPVSGLFGANTGGMVVLNPFVIPDQQMAAHLSLSGGSFGLFQQQAGWSKKWTNAHLGIQQSFQRSEGYRDNAAMHRTYLHATHQWKYRPDALLKGMVMFSDLAYQTPGGLTLQQMMDNPTSARPKTNFLPGAVEQKAGIKNKTFFSGWSHDRSWKARIRHVASVFGSYTDFQNPFITNYEHRKEGSIGARTYVDVNFPKSDNFYGKWTIGGEWQQTYSQFKNYDNAGGLKDTLRKADDLRAQQAFAFTRIQTDLFNRVLLEASLSVNFFDFRFKSIYPSKEADFSSRSFQPQWMPRVAISYVFNQLFSWRASVSRGYSVPTLSEIRASNNEINTTLQAERGINYETGIRLKDKKDVFWLDAAFFWFQLKDAIVRQVNEGGEESFVNAGSTLQPGVELSVQGNIIQPATSGFFRELSLNGNLTWNNFRFDSYKILADDFSGNPLTGTPKYVTSSSLTSRFAGDFGLFCQYYYASSIALNDANTVQAQPYHILQAKADWRKSFKQIQLSVFVGADNLLNQSYSLGNDLNAFGGRYFNPAPTRSFYGGLQIKWLK